MRFDRLFEQLSKRLAVEETESGNQLIRIPKGALRVRVGDYGSEGDGDTYSDVTCISRHFVQKPIYSITVERQYPHSLTTLKTTADHTCMRVVGKVGYGGGYGLSFERISANELRVGDMMCTFGMEGRDAEVRVTAISVNPNDGGSWVYDLEVSSPMHVYFANGVLVHNSQFINLAPITQEVLRQSGMAEDTPLSKLADDGRKHVIDEAYRILDAANVNVAELVNRECHTLHGDILHYSLEYVAAEGMYFKKKHYIVRKILSDGLPCDSFKYSGISVKKAEIPVSMKDFLKRIYETTMKDVWSESRYREEVQTAYSSFVSLDWSDIAYYRRYRTPKRALSLTESEKGAGVHARAANFYNQLIERLGIGGKYPKIGMGDEFRYLYILPTNEYGMDCIAFKGDFPQEFRSLFRPDYDKMFKKVFTKSLENYVEIMNYRTADPTRHEECPEFSIF